MASAGFTVVISATDRATAQLDAINKRLQAVRDQAARLAAPFTRLRDSFAKFLSLTGLDTVAKGFASLASGAYNAFTSLMRIIEPLAAITGAASLAGMYRLVSVWSDFGQKLGFSSARIGIAADQLQDLQNAAKLAGSSSEAMTSGLTHLTDQLNAAAGGRSPEAIAMFQTLDIAFQHADGSARSAAEVFPELQAKIAGLHDPANQARLAVMGLGGAGEELLPILRLTRAEFEKLTTEARENAHITNDSIRIAGEFAHAQNSLTQSIRGFGDAIAEQLAPVITPLLLQMRSWINANREWIAQDVGRYAKEFADYLRGVNWAEIGAAVETIFHKVEALVKGLWEWRAALENISVLVAGLFLARFIGSCGVINTRLLGLIAVAGLAYSAFNRLNQPIDGSQLPADSPLRLPGDAPMAPENRSWWNQPLHFGSPDTPTSPGSAGPPGASPGPGSAPPFVPSATPPMPGGSGPAPSWDASIPAEGRALLDAIHHGEAPDYNLGNTTGNPSHFGPYQFDAPTYSDMMRRTARPGHALEDQQVNAWELAQQAFRENHGPAQTGSPDLLSYLRRGGDAAPFLRNRWPSVPGGSQPNTNTPGFNNAYQSSLRRQQAQQPSPAPPAAAPAPPSAAPDAPAPPPQRSPVSYRIGNGDGTQTATQAAERLAGRADLVVRFANPPSGLSSSLNVTGNLWGRGPRVEMGLPQESRT